MNNTISLSEAVIRAKNTEKSVLNLIKNPDELYFQLGFLEQPNIVFACNFIVNKEFDYAKNTFYRIAGINITLNKLFDTSMFSSSKVFCYPLLSDNQKLINHYLSYEDNSLKTFTASFAKAIQSCIKNDDIELAKQIDLLLKYTSKKTWEKNFVGCVDAFKGILQNDKLLIDKGINDLIAKHDKQDHPAVVKDFINLEATTIAKLAYKKGFEVQIESPLVPKELIPTKELDHYESYDFLAPIS